MIKLEIQWFRDNKWHHIGTGKFTSLHVALDKTAKVLSASSKQNIGQHVDFDPRDLRLVPLKG